MQGNQEAIPMRGLPSADRPPPPKVSSIEHAGIRYSQETDGLMHGLDQRTGYLVAADAATGTRLWALRVYEVRMIPGLESDVQDVFFRSMSLQEDGRSIVVEDELGRRFAIELSTRSVKPAD